MAKKTVSFYISEDLIKQMDSMSLNKSKFAEKSFRQSLSNWGNLSDEKWLREMKMDE